MRFLSAPSGTLPVNHPFIEVERVLKTKVDHPQDVGSLVGP